jgi:hypothetical protein
MIFFTLNLCFYFYFYTLLINGSNGLCRVNPLFNRVVLGFKGLTILYKRVVSWLTLNGLADETGRVNPF